MAPQFNEYILDNVLRGGTLPDNTQRSTIDGWCKAVEDFCESMVVTGCQARRQQRVRPPHAWDASAAYGCRQGTAIVPMAASNGTLIRVLAPELGSAVAVSPGLPWRCLTVSLPGGITDCGIAEADIA